METVKRSLSTRETQTAALILLSAIVIYLPPLTWLLGEYLRNPWANHGLIVPIAAAYILHKRLKDRPVKISQSQGSTILGALTIFVAVCVRLLAGPSITAMTSLILYLLGATILFYGTASLPASLPAFLYLLFMYPIDVEALYPHGTALSMITGKLSHLGLRTLGVPVSYAENPLPMFTVATKTGETTSFMIDVPCMGAQQVIGYVAFAVFLALITKKPSLAYKGVSFLLGLFLMPALNVLRVIAILLIAHEYGIEAALTTFHTFGGWILFTAGVVMYLALTDWISKLPSSKIDLRQLIEPFVRPRKIKTVLLIIVITSLTLCITAQSAVNIKTTTSNNGPVDFHEADHDGNKIFDSLDAILANKTKDAIIPVIVTFEDVPPEIGVAQLIKKIGSFDVKYTYASLPGMAANLTKGQIQALTNIPIIKQVEYNALVHIMLDDATHWFGVDKAVTDFGVDGNADGNATYYSSDDIVIAVIDTGIDANHVDLDEGKVIGWKDFVNNQPNPYDDHGHGTHVSSIAAGTGEGNPSYTGVAPGAALVGVKVLDLTGSGTVDDLDAGIQWVIDNKATYGIEILNLSVGIGGSYPSDGTDSTSTLVNAAFDAGIVVVVAAGNDGPAKYTIGSPAAAEKAITVGAMADVGESGFYLASWSSRGPTADERIKPDLCAPGVSITAADAGTTNGYVSKSGTSMSTPFMAGTVALMLHANSSLTPADVKNTAMAVDWGPKGEVDSDYGYGRLDSYEAVRKAGSFTGSGPTVPEHAYKEGTLGATGDSDDWYFTVSDASYPFAITLIIPDWRSLFPIGTEPDFDLELYDPDDTRIASSTGVERQETIAVSITETGTYRVRVYSYYGSGDYFFDVSVGLAAGEADPPVYIPELPLGTMLALLTALLVAVVYRRRRKLAALPRWLNAFFL
jgi:serine protease AprX